MLKKYISKFAMDIFPSVAATIIGAYIVNHYIATKPGTNAPPAAVSTAQPQAEAKTRARGCQGRQQGTRDLRRRRQPP